MTKTANEEDRSLLAITKPSSENVYSIISGLEPRDAENELRNPQFRCKITAKLPKEAETFFFLISEGLPERLIGMIVYSLISDVDTASALNEPADSESAAQTNLKLQKEAELFFSSISQDLPARLIGVTPEDWFDRDELDRDLTPLIEQQAAENESGLKIALRIRKERQEREERKEPGQQKLSGPTEEGSA